MKPPIKITACCICGRPKYRETDPVHRPGQWSLYRLRGSCACVETPDGFTIKAGPPARPIPQ